MLPFTISLRTGLPIINQVVFAVTRAVVSGQLRAGDAFPSVRALSQELRINPNTAHRVVGALIEDGLLVVRPGIGTVVAQGRTVSAAVRRVLLEEETERLVVAAKRAGASLRDVEDAIRRQWSNTDSDD